MALAVTMLGGWDQGYWVVVLFGSIGIAITVTLLRRTDGDAKSGL